MAVGHVDASQLEPVGEPEEANEGSSGSPPGDGGGFPPPPPEDGLSVDFIRRLYRHSGLYADRHSDKQLKALHVEDRRLEGFIKQKVKEGWSIVLTGNPGDGKTHLLRRLQSVLKRAGAIIEEDATAVSSNQALIEKWRTAYQKQAPFCIAINEGPLLELAEEFGRPSTSRDGFAPLWEAQRQVIEAIYYDKEPDLPRERVIVIDLNRRTLLEAEMVAKVVRTLVSDQFYSQCTDCPIRNHCDVPRHRTRLQDPRTLSRLQEVLQLVAKGGTHATMRHLQSLLSYLIMGDRRCEELATTSGHSQYAYWQLLFRGESALFNAVREAFDPSRITHPTWTMSSGWERWIEPVGSIPHLRW